MIATFLPAPRRARPRRWATALAACALFAGCAGSPRTAQVPPTVPPPAPAAGFTLLQINDTYKIEGLRAGAEGGLARVRTLRKQLEAEGRPVLVLHAGDFLFPSVMSKYLKGAPMVDALNLLDGSEGFDERFFVTPGNHEFDNPELALLADRIAQSQFGWITSNVAIAGPAGTAEAGMRPLAERFANVKDHVVMELGGIRVGIFGLTLSDQSRPWVEYGFDLPTRRATIARVLGDLEREGARFVIALTHQEVGDDEWLAFADIVLDVAIGHFADGDGGFFDTADDAPALIHRPGDVTDDAEPSGWAAVAAACVTQAALTGVDEYRAISERALAAVTPLAGRAPRAVGWGLAAATALVAGPVEIALVLPAGGSEADVAAWVRAARRATSPGAVLAIGTDGEVEAERVPLLQDRTARDGRPTAYVCRGHVCDAPTTDLEAFIARIGGRMPGAGE